MSRPKGSTNKKKTVVESPQGEVTKFVSPSYNLSVKVLGKTFSAVGSTLEEAIDKLGIKNARGMSVWNLERNGKKTMRVLGTGMTMRIFGSKGAVHDVMLKNLSLTL